MYTSVWSWLGWFLFGIIVGGGLTALWFSLKEKVTLKWFEYLLTALAVIILGFMLQTFFGSLQEFEPQAAWMSLGFMGLPLVVIAVITMRSVMKRLPKA